MKTVIERWKSELPSFFKKLKAVAISIGTSAAAVLVANTAMTLNLPAQLIDALGYVIAVCVAIAGTSQLTKK
jgi:hypothetical protein